MYRRRGSTLSTIGMRRVRVDLRAWVIGASSTVEFRKRVYCVLSPALATVAAVGEIVEQDARGSKLSQFQSVNGE